MKEFVIIPTENLNKVVISAASRQNAINKYRNGNPSVTEVFVVPNSSVTVEKLGPKAPAEKKRETKEKADE